MILRLARTPRGAWLVHALGRFRARAAREGLPAASLHVARALIRRVAGA